jgi:hypothetical protein
MLLDTLPSKRSNKIISLLGPGTARAYQLLGPDLFDKAGEGGSIAIQLHVLSRLPKFDEDLPNVILVELTCESSRGGVEQARSGILSLPLIDYT